MLTTAKKAHNAALHKRLHSQLKYVRSTGCFVTLVNGTRRNHGDTAGTLRKDGSYIVSFEGVLYTAGQLAYFWMNSAWPSTPVKVKVKARTHADYAWNNLTHPPAEI